MKNHIGVYLKLHKNIDERIIQRLNQVDNKQGYIKALIKGDVSVYKKFMEGDKNG